jgi:cytoskeletal protein CcmA (bactofilin family)
MFKQKRRRDPAIGTLVGKDTRVNGDLEFSGGCLVDGFVMGNVRSTDGETATLSVSERGCIEGGVDVPNVLLNGTVKGDVRASQRIELGAKARVVGNVQYRLIEMAIGAEVNGKLIHESETGTVESESRVTGNEASKVAEPPDLAPVGNVNVVGE